MSMIAQKNRNKKYSRRVEILSNIYYQNPKFWHFYRKISENFRVSENFGRAPQCGAQGLRKLNQECNSSSQALRKFPTNRNLSYERCSLAWQNSTPATVLSKMYTWISQYIDYIMDLRISALSYWTSLLCYVERFIPK